MTDSNSNQRARPSPRPVKARAPSRVDSTPIHVRDNDEMFMRNQNRTSQQWKKLEELDKGKSEEKTSPRPLKQNKNGPGPSQPAVKDLRFLSSRLSDFFNSNEAVGVSKRNEAQRPSRSKSITPPLALPFHYIWNMRNIVRHTLGHESRTSSQHLDIDLDDTSETDFSNPELTCIAKAVASMHPTHVQQTSSKQESETIMVSVEWQLHPFDKITNENGNTWDFAMKRGENFRNIFEAIAKDISISTESLIVRSRTNGIRIYSSATPLALKMWNKAELVACHELTYDHNHARNTIADYQAVDADVPMEIISGSEAETQEPGIESEDNDDLINIVIRSPTAEDVTLTIPHTTKCGEIVKAFLKKASIEGRYLDLFDDKGTMSADKRSGGKKKKNTLEKQPVLSVDGVEMANHAKISEAILFDGDFVDIVGL